MCNTIYVSNGINQKNTSIPSALTSNGCTLPYPKVFFTLFHSRYSDLSGAQALNYGNGGCDGFSPNFPLNAVSFYGNTAEQKYSTPSVIVSLSLLLVKIYLAQRRPSTLPIYFLFLYPNFDLPFTAVFRKDIYGTDSCSFCLYFSARRYRCYLFVAAQIAELFCMGC